MTQAESPPAAGPHGPPVSDEEALYRCIAYPNWWNDEQRITSAAFKFPSFSVDVASLAESPRPTPFAFQNRDRVGRFLVISRQSNSAATCGSSPIR